MKRVDVSLYVRFYLENIMRFTSGFYTSGNKSSCCPNNISTSPEITVSMVDIRLCIFEVDFFLNFIIMLSNYTSTRSWRGIYTITNWRSGYIFTSVYMCVCLSVCLSSSACEQNSSRTNEPIWTWFSLNGLLTALARTLLQSTTLGQCQGHSDVISIFASLFC